MYIDLVNGLTEPSTIRMPLASINKFLEQQDSILSYDAMHTGGHRTYVAVDESKPKATSHRSSSSSQRSYTSRSGRNGSQSSRYGRSSKSSSAAATSTSKRKRGRRG